MGVPRRKYGATLAQEGRVRPAVLRPADAGRDQVEALLRDLHNRVVAVRVEHL